MHRNSKRLLILADTEPVTTRALALDLTEAGYAVETAVDRDEAIRKVRGEVFDLLIAPEEPWGDAGEIVVEAFRRTQPAAKVVLMTTEGGRTRAPGDMQVRVTKPFDLEAFRHLVGEVLEGDRKTGSAM